MLNIETLWQGTYLLVHTVHDADAPCADQLRARLSDICRDELLLASAQETAYQGRPALSFTASQSLDFLRSLQSAEPLPRTTQIWKWLADFVVDRVVAGQFFPTIETQDPGPIAVWRPLVTRKEELDWLSQAAAELARLCPSESEYPEHLVESFVNALTDVLIRRTFSEDPFFAATAARCWAPSAGADARFFGALLTENRTVPGLDREMAEQIRAWVDTLQDRPITTTFRVGFRLEEAPEPGGEHWKVIFLLVPLHGDSEPIPAERLWDLGRDLPPILGRSLAGQRQSLAEQLQRAGEIWNILREQLPEEPTHVLLSAAEAIAFARQWATQLVEAGFNVELPRWARDPSRELTIQLDLHSGDLADEELLGDVPPAGADGGGTSIGSNASRIGLSSVLQFDWRVAVGNMHLSAEQFQTILSAQRPLVQFNGEWLQVDVDAARRAAEFINENRGGQMTLADALRTAHATSRAETGLQISGLTGAGWIGQLLSQSPDAQLQALQQPLGFIGQLRPYQLRGLQWLAFLHRLGIGACLADDMGLGKTIQFIALLLHDRQVAEQRHAPTPGPTLLFAPTSVMGNWRQEMNRFAPTLRLMVHHGIQRQHGAEFRDHANDCDLVITTYALATRDREDFALVKWRRLALDEAQKIKNPAAASTQAIRQIPAGFRVALTGTPIENHLSELWSIMEILNPGLLGSASAFREQFAVPIERVGDASRAHHLRELIKPFVLRRTKSDPAVSGDLPEKLEMKVYCNLTVEQAALYQRITEEMLGQIDSASGIRRRGLILAALTRLKQICNHPVMLDGKIAGFNARPNDLDSRSGKCERLAEMLQEVLDEGDSALVFTQYKEMGDILETFLSRRLNEPVLYLHGGTPASARDTMISSFQDPKGKTRVFLLSLRAGGLGLNLTRANHVFHFDRWWNPAVEQQATDRAHRIGQTRTVQVHKYICIGTMEERIDRMIGDKMQLADRIITSGDDWLTNLSTDELRRTLELSADAVEDDNPGAT